MQLFFSLRTQRVDFLRNFLDDLDEAFIAAPCRIRKSPVLIKCSADIRAADITPHGNRYIRHRDLIDRLAVLALFHIYPISLFHQPHSVLVDLRLGLCPGRIEIKPILCQLLSQRFGDLTAAGIMHADKRYFFLLHHRSSNACLFCVLRNARSRHVRKDRNAITPVSMRLHSAGRVLLWRLPAPASRSASSPGSTRINRRRHGRLRRRSYLSLPLFVQHG